MKTIHIDIFDKTSVDNAILELKSFNSGIKRRANILCETVAAMIADEIENNLSGIEMSDDIKNIGDHTTTPVFPILGSEVSGSTVIIKGVEVVFVEFGAGIYYNPNGQTNPLASRVSFETEIGSFGAGNGSKKYWFIAHNLISCGSPAYMPIYRAIEMVKPQIPTLARIIFA